VLGLYLAAVNLVSARSQEHVQPIGKRIISMRAHVYKDNSSLESGQTVNDKTPILRPPTFRSLPRSLRVSFPDHSFYVVNYCLERGAWAEIAGDAMFLQERFVFVRNYSSPH